MCGLKSPHDGNTELLMEFVAMVRSELVAVPTDSDFCVDSFRSLANLAGNVCPS